MDVLTRKDRSEREGVARFRHEIGVKGISRTADRFLELMKR